MHRQLGELSTVPKFFAEVKGLSHATGYNSMQGPMVGWLRWLLAGDETMRQQFSGPDCGVYKRPNWMTMSQDLDKVK